MSDIALSGDAIRKHRVELRSHAEQMIRYIVVLDIDHRGSLKLLVVVFVPSSRRPNHLLHLVSRISYVSLISAFRWQQRDPA